MKVLETNIYGTFLITRELIKKYKVEKVINISSTDSIDTYSDLNIDYSLSKCGINFMTKFFSNKYKDIKFYNILPNWINTETIQNMNSEYLESELRRVNQDKLITIIGKTITDRDVVSLIRKYLSAGVMEKRIDGD